MPNIQNAFDAGEDPPARSELGLPLLLHPRAADQAPSGRLLCARQRPRRHRRALVRLDHQSGKRSAHYRTRGHEHGGRR
ncbi:MAG: hypothetical protein L6W00_29360 [Lentisphaeria bacterium]|nr:MAG: hypothetical protein L6W00_29360 [Lentisphaeria bacterium]